MDINKKLQNIGAVFGIISALMLLDILIDVSLKVGFEPATAIGLNGFSELIKYSFDLANAMNSLTLVIGYNLALLAFQLFVFGTVRDYESKNDGDSQ